VYHNPPEALALHARVSKDGMAEEQMNQVKKDRKSQSLTAAVMAYPDRFNPDTTSKALLGNGGWEEHEIKALMDTRNDVDRLSGFQQFNRTIDALCHTESFHSSAGGSVSP
jgi:hypothetical protein